MLDDHDRSSGRGKVLGRHEADGVPLRGRGGGQSAVASRHAIHGAHGRLLRRFQPSKVFRTGNFSKTY